jgi:hypothetical protein
LLPTGTSWSIAISRNDGNPDKARALALELKKYAVYTAWVKNSKIPFRIRREGIFNILVFGIWINDTLIIECIIILPRMAYYLPL